MKERVDILSIVPIYHSAGDRRKAERSEHVHDPTLRAAVQRVLEDAAIAQEIAHEIYSDDAVLSFPQSQERFEGRRTFRVWRKMYAAAVELKIRRIRDQGNVWVGRSSLPVGERLMRKPFAG